MVEAIVYVVLMVAFYFLPTIVAQVNRKQTIAGIFLLNFLLGWTGLGWIGALVWASCKDKTL